MDDNATRQRGRRIAARLRIVRKGRMWHVPSESRDAVYVVDLAASPPTCTCLDWDLRRDKCKHVYAAEFVAAGDVEDLPAATAPTAPAPRVARPTYRQNWPAYNLAQSEEKDRLAALLRGLCDGIVSPPHSGPGRPRLPLPAVVFAAVAKVYGLSATNADPVGRYGRRIRTPSRPG